MIHHALQHALQELGFSVRPNSRNPCAEIDINGMPVIDYLTVEDTVEIRIHDATVKIECGGDIAIFDLQIPGSIDDIIERVRTFIDMPKSEPWKYI